MQAFSMHVRVTWQHQGHLLARCTGILDVHTRDERLHYVEACKDSQELGVIGGWGTASQYLEQYASHHR